MWTITERDITHLQGGGGEPLAQFVNSLLRSQCLAYGIPESALATSLSTTHGDGGADTRIDQQAANDNTGYLSQRSAWQFKGVKSLRPSEARTDINKPYATELVKRGYGYRLAVAFDPTPRAKESLETALNSAAQEICKNAQPCLVITASDLAAWANRFPGLVASHFNRPSNIALHGNAWSANQTAITSNYVIPPGAHDCLDAISTHVQLSNRPSARILHVRGPAGVGKTRLVFEAIRAVPGALSLVVVTSDGPNAVEVTHRLANSDGLTAILVADECPDDERFRLNELVSGHEHRIRIVVIDNSGERLPDGSPAVWVDAIRHDTTEEILRKNFPSVAAERRRAYADLCQGYIRLAADLCQCDPRMQATGRLQPAIPALDQYFTNRLQQDDRKVVQALSLVDRIGYAKDVSGQLDALASLTGIEKLAFKEAAARLKDAPGFIAATPRYFYVTPQIIGEIAFRRAWMEFAQLDPPAFLDSIPESLRAPFERRIRGLADPEVRSIVSTHFRERTARLEPADLADQVKSAKLLGLVETDPAVYFPQLARLVRDANPDELLATGDPKAGTKATRRELVWWAERLAIFPEHFNDAEAILRRLALAETDRGIGNNATGVWQQMQRIYSSGTSTPFAERFTTFRNMLWSGVPEERDLALGALNHLIDVHSARAIPPALVAGRLPPVEWRPTTGEEAEECLSLVTGLAEDMISGPEPLPDAAWQFFITYLQRLLAWGKLGLLQGLVERHPLPEHLLGPWLEQVDEFLQHEGEERIDAHSEKRLYSESVQKWKASILPAEFAARLRAALGKSPWYHSIREDIHKRDSEISPLVDEAIAQPALLEENLDYLCSPDAKSAAVFGALLGARDRNADFLDRITTASRRERSTALVRGYVSGLPQEDPGHAGRISAVLDSLESTDPELAAEIIGAQLQFTDPVKRLTRLVADRNLNPAYLRYLHSGGLAKKISSRQFAEVLLTLRNTPDRIDAVEIAVDLIGDRWQGETTINEEPETLELIRSTLRLSATRDDGADFWWRQAMERLADIDPEWAAESAVEVFSGDAYRKRDDANSILTAVAQKHPDLVMASVGSAILDPRRGWHWLIGANREIFSSLPVDIIMKWLTSAGIEGVRRLARHLSAPTLATDGTPIIPELTENVLAAYGDDEDVFSEFLAGCHNLEVSWGPLSSRHEGQARVARACLNHRLPVIRKWAEQELAEAEQSAEAWRRYEEDEGLNF